MGLGRFDTTATRPGIINLSAYEFDTGIRGVGQRILKSIRNMAIRSSRRMKSLFTSFLGIHFIYVVIWVFVLSWIIYPYKNISYTDALFMSTSAITNTGLNTVDVNSLKTYQIAFLFICPIFTHPLTTSMCLLFYRLWLYRKKFQDIESMSKHQSRLRRAATMSQYENSKRRSRDQPPTVNIQLGDRSTLQETNDSSNSANEDKNEDFLERSSISSREHSNHSSARSSNDSLRMGSRVTSVQRSRHSTSDSDSLSQSSANNDNISDNGDNGDNGDGDGDGSGSGDDDDNDNKIRFGELPRPKKEARKPHHHRKNLDPTEMFRSLNMMRSRHIDPEIVEDDGPALVIKSPRDIEEDEKRGIHGKVYVEKQMNQEDNNNDQPNAGDTIGENSDYPAPILNTGDQTQFSYQNNPQNTSTTFDSNALQRPGNNRTFSRYDTVGSLASNRAMTSNYLSWTPTVARNSAFIGLTTEQKEELGGVEYRALKLLRWFILVHYLIIILTGWLFIIPYSFKQQKYNVLIRSFGVSPLTFGFTTVLSAFYNCGLCVLPVSISAFQENTYIPVVLTFITLAGNVFSPICLRFYIWVTFKVSPKFGRTKETLGFLLDHPRRCFMYLFPSTTTWWLIFTILIFMIIDIMMYMILNQGAHSQIPNEHPGRRLMFAYFQTVMTTTTGFSMIDIGQQHPAMLILNIVMIYIAIYPLAITIRKSNVYEEQSLGRFYKKTPSFAEKSEMSSEQELEEEEDEEGTPSSLVDHVRRQLSMDIWSLVLGLFVVAISEGGRITKGEFDLFDIIYEVVSAHGTVGLSIGYGTLSTSGGFNVVGKVAMILLMIRSRHRAMPYTIDRAVILRGKEFTRRDAEQENRVRASHTLIPPEVTATSSSWFPRVSSLNPMETLRRRNTGTSNRSTRTE